MWNQEYVKLIECFQADNDFMGWYGMVGEYIQAFQIKRAFEIDNDWRQGYDPLESNLKDAYNI
jgi:hypothetical protein